MSLKQYSAVMLVGTAMQITIIITKITTAITTMVIRTDSTQHWPIRSAMWRYLRRWCEQSKFHRLFQWLAKRSSSSLRPVCHTAAWSLKTTSYCSFFWILACKKTAAGHRTHSWATAWTDSNRIWRSHKHLSMQTIGTAFLADRAKAAEVSPTLDSMFKSPGSLI